MKSPAVQVILYDWAAGINKGRRTIMKNKFVTLKRGIVAILTAALVLSPLPAAMMKRAAEKAEATDATLQNPYIVPDDGMKAGKKVTWDCVYFGSYPQAEVIPGGVEYTALDASLRREGDVIVSDSVHATLQSASSWDENNDIILRSEEHTSELQSH